MGLTNLLRRRLGTHPVAVLAIAISVMMSLVVVTALRLLSTDISDAGVRTALDVPPADRSFTVSAALDPGELEAADRAVRSAVEPLGPVPVTRVATTTSRGIDGRPDTDRAVLADVGDLPDAADLVDGAWPQAPGGSAARPGGGVVDVALPEDAATALGVAVGDELTLVDLVDDDAPRQEVRVSGVFRPRDAQDVLWTDLPLALTGVQESDFSSYGPFVLAPGGLDGKLFGSSTVTWRAAPALDDLTTAQLPAARDRATAATAALGALDLRSVRVGSPVPALLTQAALVAERIRVSLLVPTVLLAALGAVSLAVAAALLAGLRDGETRLLRTRGASTAQLALLALGEAVLVAVLAIVGTVLVAPPVARAVAGSLLGGSGAGGGGRVWSTAVPLAVAAVAVTVATTVWAGRAAGRRPGRSRGRVLRAVVGSGLDVVLVALAVLGALQLRRYDAAATTAGVDPLTTVAPVLVIAGLAVLSLRLIPVLARVVARLGAPRRGLDLAWGSWQFARRVSGQAGTLLLVLLAVGVGTVALGLSATAVRAVADQSAFDSGAPLRVVRANAAVGVAALERVTEQASGGADRVMPVNRSAVRLGDLEGVTVLAADSDVAGTVMDPRPDTVRGTTWQGAVEALVTGRDLGGGIELPAATREVEVTARLIAPAELRRVAFPAALHVRDGRGIVSAVPLGSVGTTPTTLEADLEGAGLTGPLAVVGMSVPLPERVFWVVSTSSLDLDVETLEADGTVLDTTSFSQHRPSTGLWWAVPPGSVDSVPAVVTADVADAVEGAGGGPLVVQVGTIAVPVRVAAVVDVLPTADDPARGVLVDLPTVQATPQQGVRPSTVVRPGELWADPPDPEAAAAAVRAEVPYGTTVVVRSEVEDERLANPVNAGMRAAMALVTLAAVLLAAVGFAATTAALGRARRHENAVLHALGMPPRRIGTVLLLERVLVTVVTVVVGVGLGLVAAVTVVPLLVGGDGHPQVPPVLVEVPAAGVLLLAGAVTVVLSLVGMLVLRSSVGDLGGELRGGEEVR
jgi:hypothetical protein